MNIMIVNVIIILKCRFWIVLIIIIKLECYYYFDLYICSIVSFKECFNSNLKFNLCNLVVIVN